MLLVNQTIIKKINQDFDYTLTRRQNISINNKRAYFSTYCILEHSHHTPDSFKEEKDRLFKFYHNYEDDITIEYETRSKMMKEW